MSVMTPLCFLLFTSALLGCSWAIQFNYPYVLLLNTEPDGKNVLIKTDTCYNGGFSSVPFKLKKFCASGFWILITEWCADSGAQKYYLSARDSCFEVPDDKDIKIKRFMPILQNMSDFEGYAFAWKQEAAYFVKLDAVKGTALKPMDGNNKDWTVMTTNLHFYDRHLQEIGAAVAPYGSRRCYTPMSTGNPFLFYHLMGDKAADTEFKPYIEPSNQGCPRGFSGVHYETDLKIGTFSWSDGVETTEIRSDSGAYALDLDHNNIVLAAQSGKKTAACADDSKEKGYLSWNETLSLDKYPEFPHNFPPEYTNFMIKDEIQETSQFYSNHRLFHSHLPAINFTEYTMMQTSMAVLEKFCCQEEITSKAMTDIKTLFRLTMLYFQEYFPYEEPSDPKQNERILTALQMCGNGSEHYPATCITVNASTSCPGVVNESMWNGTAYAFDMPEYLKFEPGNVDYVTETIWKSMLFVHYQCASFFADPADHSAFEVKIEGFFNPMVKTKWAMPQNAYRVYQLLLNYVDLKKFGEAIDICVNTAHEVSEYKRWLSRPDIFSLQRKKRAAPAADLDNDAEGDCITKSKPKAFCMKKQFDMIDHNIVQTPKGGECYNSYVNRAKYKYIHAGKFGTAYS